MLMRTDPLREIDRLAPHVLGTPSRPAVVPMDTLRSGDGFSTDAGLPGIAPESTVLDVELNTLTVQAECRPPASRRAELSAAERPAAGPSPRLAPEAGPDAERTNASYDAGVPPLRDPLAEQSTPDKIQAGSDSARQLAG